MDRIFLLEVYLVLIDTLSDDCSGAFTLRMCTYFASFFTDQDGQQRRVVYQNPFAFDLALLFITSIGSLEKQKEREF